MHIWPREPHIRDCWSPLKRIFHFQWPLLFTTSLNPCQGYRHKYVYTVEWAQDCSNISDIGSSSGKLQPGGGSGTGFYKLYSAGTGEGLLSEMGYHEKFITQPCHAHRCLKVVNNTEGAVARNDHFTLLMVPPIALFLHLLRIQFAMIFSSDGQSVLTL